MKELCNTVNVNDGKKGRSEFFHQIKLDLFDPFEVTTS